jgi:hypothetical protein
MKAGCPDIMAVNNLLPPVRKDQPVPGCGFAQGAPAFKAAAYGVVEKKRLECTHEHREEEGRKNTQCTFIVTRAGIEVVKECPLVPEGDRKGTEGRPRIAGCIETFPGCPHFLLLTGIRFSRIDHNCLLIFPAENILADLVSDRTEDPETLDPEIVWERFPCGPGDRCNLLCSIGRTYLADYDCKAVPAG